MGDPKENRKPSAHAWRGGATPFERIVISRFNSMPRSVRVGVYVISFGLVVHFYLMPTIIRARLVSSVGQHLEMAGWEAIYYVENNRSTMEVGKYGELNIPIFMRAPFDAAITIQVPQCPKSMDIRLPVGSILLSRLTSGAIEIALRQEGEAVCEFTVMDPRFRPPALASWLTPNAYADEGSQAATVGAEGAGLGSASLEEVAKAAEPFVDSGGVRVRPIENDARLRNAIDAMDVPQNEVVVMQFDSTLFGSGKQGILATNRGLYYRTDWSRAAGPRVAFIPYEALSAREIARWNWAEVSLGDGQFFVTAGSDLSSRRLAELLNAIKSAAAGAEPTPVE